jgi:hypothetical protein
VSIPRGNPEMNQLQRELARLGSGSGVSRPRGGGMRRAGRWVSRVIGRGENPIHWAFPVGTVAGVPMRMHVFVILWAAVELIASALRSQMGGEYAVAAVLAFVFIAMIREAARVAWAQRHAAVADVSIIWPLGALNAITPASRAHAPAALRPRHAAGVHCELGGTFVGIAMAPIFAGAAMLVGVPGHALWDFSFFTPASVMADLSTRWQYVFWWLHYANMAILIANAAMYAPCFDAGRVLARAMRDRRATNRAAITLWAGLASSVVVLLLALAESSVRLGIVGLVTALCTWLVFRSQTFLAEASAPARPAFVGMVTSASRPGTAARPRSSLTKSQRSTGPAAAQAAANSPVIEHPARPSRAPLRATVGATAPAPAPPTREQVDAILGQISREGIASLSQEQRDALDAATRQLRSR